MFIIFLMFLGFYAFFSKESDCCPSVREADDDDTEKKDNNR